MKNKFNFFLPKIAGFALLAGVGIIVFSLLFKLLIAAVFITIGVVAVKSVFKLVNQIRGVHGHPFYNDYKIIEHPFVGTNEPTYSSYQELPIIPIK